MNYQNYELRIMISNFMFSVREHESWKIVLDEWRKKMFIFHENVKPRIFYVYLKPDI